MADGREGSEQKVPAAGYTALSTELSPREASLSGAGAAEALPEGLTQQVCLKLEGQGEIWGTEADLGDDAWGAAIVSLARYLTVITLKRSSGHSVMIDLTNLITSVAVMFANLALQTGVLWYIWMYVVEPAVHSVQYQYRHFRAHVQDEHGVVDPHAWSSYEFKNAVCEIAMVNATFYYSILMLWILTNMSEWRAIERLNRSLSRMQTVHSAKEALHFTLTGSFELGGPCLILGLTTFTRVAIYVVVIIPRLLISIFLSWLGLRMLTSSASFSDMVLNSLALGFVISIDELLCQAVLPVATRKHMEETNLFIKEGHQAKTLPQLISAEWQGFKRTAFLMVAAAIYLFLYGEYLQQVLPVEVRELGKYCQPYIATMQNPICSQAAYLGGGSCFPPGVGDRFDNDT